MYKNYALLSIGATLLCSLCFIDAGHAFQIDRRQDARILMAGGMKGTANLATIQVSTTPNPCTDGGKGLIGAPGNKQCPSGSGEMATAGSLYTRQVSNTPNPCTEGGKGLIGAPGNKRCPPGSGEQAANGSPDTSASMLVSLPAAGILFGVGLTALVRVGASRLRHHHGHRA